MVDFRVKEVSNGNRSDFRELITEISLSTEMGLSWGSGNFVENVPGERSATSACTSASAVSVLGSVCVSVACCSAACKI